MLPVALPRIDILTQCLDVLIEAFELIPSMLCGGLQRGSQTAQFPLNDFFHLAHDLGSRLSGSLTFEPMDTSLYPCFELALNYAKRGGTWPAVLAGADEAAVSLFLDGRIRFTEIPDVVAATLADHTPIMEHSVENAVQAAAWANEHTMANHAAEASV